MKPAKLAYLTSPSEGQYILSFQFYDSPEVLQIDVSPEMFKNILSSGVRLMLDSSYHRVPLTQRESQRDELSPKSIR